jgi:hypothetical protein
MAGKRFTRYYGDADFRAAVDREFALAAAETKLGGWITYGIYDAQRANPNSEYDGLFIYVGQSKEYGKRIRKRMSDAGRARWRPTDRIDGALYDLMNRGGIPRFQVLERVSDAVASFVSETNWAKRLKAKGHPLLNQWTEQRFGGLDIDRRTVPHDWLWRLAIEDALVAGIDMIIKIKETGDELVLDLSDFRPKELLRKVRSRALEKMRETGRAATIRLHVQ